MFYVQAIFKVEKQIIVTRVKSGEYGGWGNNSNFNSLILAITTTDEWADVLSW